MNTKLLDTGIGENLSPMKRDERPQKVPEKGTTICLQQARKPQDGAQKEPDISLGLYQ